MGKVIVVTSGKGGVGKTAAVSNIAVALSKSGKKVLIADIDIGLRNLDIAMGMSDVIVYDIIDVLEEKCELEKALFKFEQYGNLDFLPAAQSTDKEYLYPEKFHELFGKLKNDYDYILLDCPAGIDNGFKSAVAASDMGIVVVTPDLSSVRDADKVIDLLEIANVSEVKILINRVRPDLIRKGDMLSIDEITDILGVSPVGIVLEDETVLKSQKRHTLAVLDKSSPAGNEFRNVAGRLEGKNIPIIRLKGKRKNFFSKLFGL